MSVQLPLLQKNNTTKVNGQITKNLNQFQSYDGRRNNSQVNNLDGNIMFNNQINKKVQSLEQSNSLSKTSYIKDINSQSLKVPSYDLNDTDDENLEQKISIFIEPTTLIQIPTIDQDLQLIKQNNGLQQKPVDTYLEHCKSYARTNIRQKELQVPKYTFKKKDFQSGVLNLIIIDKMMQEGALVDQSQQTDNDISLCFQMEQMKLFLDFIFCNHQQYLLVKTWQKVTFQTPQQRLLYANSNQGGPVSDIEKGETKKLGNNKQKPGYQDQVFQETTFYIKTFQVFDKLGAAVGDPVLVEQVFGKFDNQKLYDTSILQRDQKLYYFKRLYEDNNSKQNLQDQQQSDEDQNFLDNLNRHEQRPSKKNLKRLTNLQNQKQFMQLFSYDIKTNREQQIQNIRINEQEWANSYDKELQDQLLETMRKKISLQDFSQLKPQYNILMSQQFGPTANIKHDDEISWLKEQYFTVQRYTQNQESNPFRIYKIDEYILGNLDDSLVIEMSLNNQHTDNNDMIMQIQYMSHIKNYSEKVDGSSVSFMINNLKLQIQIQYDQDTKICREPQPQLRKPTDIFQRIWNNGGIIAQMTKITQLDGSSQKEDFDQYFFVDSRNQIQLLFPQTESKVEKLKLIEIIGLKNKLIPQDFNYFKKITCINHNENGQCSYKNTIQKIDHLKKILAYDKINSAQSLTYLKDSHSEVLFVSEASSKSILLFQLFDSNQIKCEIISSQQAQITNEIIKASDRQSIIKKQVTSLVTNQGTKELSTQQNEIDIEEPYLMFRLSDRKSGKFNKNEVEILQGKERLDHVLIDDFNGQQLKVKTHIIEQEDQYDDMSQQLRLILCQQTSGNEYILFLFVVQNSLQMGQSNDAFNDSRINKRSYIFVRKTYSQMNEIFNSMCSKVIIQKDDVVHILKSYNIFQEIKFSEIRKFQFRQELTEIKLLEFEESQNQNKEKIIPYEEIKIVLSKAANDKCKINFVPMVYQQKQVSESIKLLIYDISQNKITESISVSPSLLNQDYMYEDEQGYKKFMLCRTSAMSDELKNKSLYEGVIQRAKYQFFTLYQEKVGRIMCEEFLVVHEVSGARIQTIGQKNIILSQQVIQNCEWINIRDSQVVPYQDKFGLIKGCQILLKTKQDCFAQINLCDQDMNNIYTYKSSVLITGKKKFVVSEIDQEQYVMVISTQIRKNIIIKNLFDRSEAYIILQRSLDLLLTMRVPDLEFLVLNSFDDLKNLDFFQSQEILLGKSICDICLSEPDSINKAVKEYDFENNQRSHGSIIEQLTQNDQVRKQTFIQTKFYPKQLLLQIDLNLVGTIKRAIEFSNYKSLKIILLQVMDVIDSQDYQPIVMLDLPTIMVSKQIQVNEFFNISKTEKENESGFCNLEVEFKDPDLPVFHDKPFDFFTMPSFENFLQYERDILNKILEMNKIGNNIEKTHEIEYYYIDFTQIIIGEKLKNLNSKETLKFNDVYYSKLMKIKCNAGESGNTFFAQETVQKIIDSQWRLTKQLQQQIFIIYLLLYCVPMCVSAFKYEDYIDQIMFKIALFPACMLGFIEITQLHEQGWSYFQGWNIVDSLQILIYSLLFCLRLMGFDNTLVFFPELKLVNIILAFMKVLFFIRIYEQFGFLVQMILSCLQALVPFIISYIVFLLVFSVCYVVLGMEIDEEVSGVQGLGYFQMTVLQTFRTAIGELGMPKYEEISKNGTPIFKDINIFLIWLVWFVHTFFMLVIMLNFLIAVISSNYEQTMIYQKLIGYRHKAELNYETYMLVNVFKKMDEYKCIVFQCSKSNENYNQDEFDEKFDSLKKFISRENKRVMTDYLKLNENMQNVKDQQLIMDKQVHLKFNSLHSLQKEIKEELFEAFKDLKMSIQNKH